MKVSDLQVRAYPKCHMKTKWKNYRPAQNKVHTTEKKHKFL